MSLRHGVFWALLAGLALRLASAETPQASFAAGADYRLGPGDVVDISVFEVEELSRPAVIASDGTIALPLVGAVPLGGLTPREAADRLRLLYAAGLVRDPQVAVTIREYHSQPVAVLGAVAKPGVYQLRGSRRLSDVLALAGGLSSEAGSRITIARPTPEGGEQAIEVSVAALLAADSAAANNPQIEPHDTIRVVPAGVVYVVGEVVRAGGFPIKHQETLTVLKALSLAEGLRRTSAPQRARILRRSQQGQSEISVKVRDVLAGRAPDPPLAPDDILFIPNSQARSAAGRAAEAAIQVATGVVIWRR
jgi:polysaccharide export outer membrane protein